MMHDPTPLTPGQILIVEPQPAERMEFAQCLSSNGFDVRLAGCSTEFLDALNTGKVGLVLLSTSTPGLDAYSICRRLLDAHGPAVILTAKAVTMTDRVIGLEIGADDVLAKPIHRRELIARVRAVLRRCHHIGLAGASRIVKFEGYALDTIARRIMVGDTEAHDLTEREFELLTIFLQRAGTPLSRKAITEILAARGANYTERAVDTLIARLRKKLGGADAPIIRTIRGFGYQCSVGPARAPRVPGRHRPGA